MLRIIYLVEKKKQKVVIRPFTSVRLSFAFLRRISVMEMIQQWCCCSTYCERLPP